MKIFILVVLLVFSFDGFASQEKIEAYGPQAEALKKEMAEKMKEAPPEALEQMESGNKKIAEQLKNPGLKVGQKAPNFKLIDQNNNKVSLDSLIEKGPVIISFYRGGWCPYCNLQLRNLIKNYHHFAKYNATLVAVTPQTPDKSFEQVKKDNVPFLILSDLTNKTMKDYNVYFELPQELVLAYLSFGLDVESYNGKNRAVLPVPATFVVDTKGVIVAAFADLDYTKRMEPEDIIAALKKL